jgi:4'-phosphopantetheinyl transferase
MAVGISISHSGGAVFCVASLRHAPLGVDLERIEPRPPCFVADFFAAEEAEACAAAERDTLVTAVWCGKEAVLKALHLGLRVDARDVVCVPQPPPDARPDTGWLPIAVRKGPAAPGRLAGWWRGQAGFVRAVALAAPPRGAA